VCSIVAAVVFLGGAGYLLTRPKVYQSVSSVALLPVTSNAGSLPNYPTMIASLIPTYVQLVSSPVLLNRVAATLPFAISEAQLANDVHAEALSNAAVINIVAQSRSAIRATQIASRTTDVFLANLRGNGVVVPRIYAQPTVPTKPAPPSTKLMLAAILALAVILGLVAGLLWDRLFEVGGEEERQRGSRAPPEAPPPSELPEASVPSVLPEASVPSVLGVIPELAGQRDVSTILAARTTSVLRVRWKSLRSNLMYATVGRQVRSVTITSVHPGEGKTTVAVNLAVSLAELGLSVVLVDAAMDGSTLHEVFGLDNKRGLTSTVLDETDPASLLNAVPSMAGLHVVTAGPQLPADGETRLYPQQLSRFCSLGDLVIVDSPPLQSDAADGMTAGVTDAVVLVVRAGLDTPEQVEEGLRILQKYDTPMLGTVLIMEDGAVSGAEQSRDPDDYPMAQSPSAGRPSKSRARRKS
jgi:capsular exopolysaccharide synthesis family protein